MLKSKEKKLVSPLIQFLLQQQKFNLEYNAQTLLYILKIENFYLIQMSLLYYYNRLIFFITLLRNDLRLLTSPTTTLITHLANFCLHHPTTPNPLLPLIQHKHYNPQHQESILWKTSVSSEQERDLTLSGFRFRQRAQLSRAQHRAMQLCITLLTKVIYLFTNNSLTLPRLQLQLHQGFYFLLVYFLNKLIIFIFL